MKVCCKYCFGNLNKLNHIELSLSLIQYSFKLFLFQATQFSCCSAAQSCLILCNLVDCSTLGFPVLHHLLELAQTQVHCVRGASNHLILHHPLFFLPSMFPSIRVFSNKSPLCSRWPKYWSFSFSISPSSEYSGLTGWISLQSKGLSRVFSSTTIQKHQFFGAQLSLWSNSHIHT